MDVPPTHPRGQADPVIEEHPESARSFEVEVSVVIPCLNEEDSIAFCVDEATQVLRAAGICGEVIVADNGSTDGSAQISRQHGARVVSVAAKGYGSALQGGFKEARGRFIIMADADGSYNFSEMPRFVGKLREGFDLVMGNRFAGEIQPGAMPWLHRYVGTPVMSAIINLLFQAGTGDVNCGMRAFTKRLWEHMDLRTTGMEFASEFVIKAARSGARVAEIPITLRPDRRRRPPHLRSFRDGWRHLRFMLLYAPDWLFILPGVLLFLLGVALVLWLLPGPRHLGRIEIDLHTMLFGMMFALLGTQIVSIGLFAKVFSYTERFSRTHHGLERWLKRITLEQGLALGAIFILIGGSGAIWVLWKWVASGFGPLHDVRFVLFSSLWVLLGVQVVFSSFFLSMLGINRGTYIGDDESA